MNAVEFSEDRFAYKAVLYDILCISEAVARLLQIDPKVVERNAEIPWRQVADIANVLRHEYGRVDPDQIWATVKGPALAALLQAIDAELAEIDGRSDGTSNHDDHG